MPDVARCRRLTRTPKGWRSSAAVPYGVTSLMFARLIKACHLLERVGAFLR